MTNKDHPGPELDRLAQEIDEAIAARAQHKLMSLISVCDEAYDRAAEEGRVRLLYMASNASSALQTISNTDIEAQWSWDQPNTIDAVLRLRRAMIETGYDEAHPVFKAQIATNLANFLSQLGRQIEAVELWDSALRSVPNFAMAHGNRGLGLIQLARALYDEGHEIFLLESAEQSLRRALKADALWDSGEHPEARMVFEERLSSVSAWLNQFRSGLAIDRSDFTLGGDSAEIAYRTWCLRERLFLNPLNDIMTDPLAAQDVLHLPSHSYQIDETPRFPKYYNLLKQEYVSARFRLFSSMDGDTNHSAVRDVLLIDGEDGGVFGHRLDDLRLSFRATYSLFDKIAVFLNDYFGGPLSARNTSFRRVFEREVKGAGRQLHPEFHGSRNLPLRGLYFLGKDLFDDDFRDVAAPDAQELASLRNQLEHRFLSLQHYQRQQSGTDEHAYISVDDFQAKTLRLLRLARAALIYLSFTMGAEEERRASNDGLALR